MAGDGAGATERGVLKHNSKGRARKGAISYVGGVFIGGAVGGRRVAGLDIAADGGKIGGDAIILFTETL